MKNEDSVSNKIFYVVCSKNKIKYWVKKSEQPKCKL